MKAITCNACGSNELTKIGDYYYCDYCGTRFLQEEEERQTDDVAAALANAKNAYKTRAYEACQLSCNRVLEVQPDNPVAIYLRGASIFRFDESKTVAERSSWKTACTMAVEQQDPSAALAFAVACYPVAIDIITDRKIHAIRENSSIVEELKKRRDAAKEREERMEDDILFRAANEFQGFLSDVSGTARQTSVSSEKLDAQIDSAKDEFIAIEARYVDEASRLLGDTWALVGGQAAPAGLYRAMRHTVNELCESVGAIRQDVIGHKFKAQVDAAEVIAKRVGGNMNVAIIEAAEMRHPGTKAEYGRFLTDINAQRAQRDAEVKALEVELENTRLFEIKKQFALRSELSSLRSKVIGPADPTAAFAERALSLLE